MRRCGWTANYNSEAYDAETVLSELAVEAGRYVEIDPLLEKVGRPGFPKPCAWTDIVILVREGNFSTGRVIPRLGQPLDIAANSRILTAPGAQNAPIEVYFDKPSPGFARSAPKNFRRSISCAPSYC